MLMSEGDGPVQSLSCVWLFATPWTAARQASLSFTTSWSLLRLMSIESVITSSHLVLCRPFLLLPASFPMASLSKGVLEIFSRWAVQLLSVIRPCGLFCSISCASGAVFQSPKPKAQEPGMPMSEGREDVCSSRDSTFVIPRPFCSVQVPSGLDDAYLYQWRQSLLLSLLIQIPSSSRNAFTDTPRDVLPVLCIP